MAQKIRIAAIEVKEGANDRGPWKSYLIHGEDKAKFSTFDPSASVLKVGDMLEAEIEVKGKFTNLKSFTVTGHAEPPAPSEKPAGAYHDDREDRTDVRTAVMQAAALWTAGKLTDKDVEVIGLRKWLTHLLCPPTVVTTSAIKSGQRTAQAPKYESPFPTSPAVDELLKIICERKKFPYPANARRWITDVCKISSEQIDADPESTWTAIKALQGWE